jgi:hypothetical protein
MLHAAMICILLSGCGTKTTCSDGIHNQGEKLIDCGGPCAPCPTCADGIQNQGECGIDCGGGLCAPCITCADGVQNQGETGVDCGGPCNKCPVVYPRIGYYGGNILRKDTITLKASPPTSIPSNVYSFRGEVPEGSSLRIVMKNTTVGSNSVWYYYPDKKLGWDISPYDYTNNLQVFNAPDRFNYDVLLYFTGSGAATIEFYENGAISPTRIKNITWN